MTEQDKANLLQETPEIKILRAKNGKRLFMCPK